MSSEPGPAGQRNVGDAPAAVGSYHDRRLLRLLARSRYAIGVALVGTFIAATALLLHGVIETTALIRAVVSRLIPGATDSGVDPPLLAAIHAVDVFLVAVVLYFTAAGLYQLSFHPLPLPEWLVVRDLSDLEHKLLNVVVVVLTIAFLGQVVTWDGERDLLGIGVATALAIAALALHLRRPPPSPPAEM